MVNHDHTGKTMRIIKNTKIKLSKDSDTSTARKWVFDFEGVDEATRCEIAARALVITLAQNHRNGKAVPGDGAIIAVADMVAKRSIMAPIDEMKSLSAALTDEQKAEMIAELSK